MLYVIIIEITEEGMFTEITEQRSPQLFTQEELPSAGHLKEYRFKVLLHLFHFSDLYATYTETILDLSKQFPGEFVVSVTSLVLLNTTYCPCSFCKWWSTLNLYFSQRTIKWGMHSCYHMCMLCSLISPSHLEPKTTSQHEFSNGAYIYFIQSLSFQSCANIESES